MNESSKDFEPETDSCAIRIIQQVLKLESTDKTQGAYVLAWGRGVYFFIFRKWSASFNYEYSQQSIMVLARPVILSPREITDIFMSHYLITL